MFVVKVKQTKNKQQSRVFLFFFNTTYIIPRNKFGLPYLSKQPQEQRYPFLPVCAVIPCVQTVPVVGECLTRTDVDVHGRGRGKPEGGGGGWRRGVSSTVTESALKVGSGRKPLAAAANGTRVSMNCSRILSLAFYSWSCRGPRFL